MTFFFSKGFPVQQEGHEKISEGLQTNVFWAHRRRKVDHSLLPYCENRQALMLKIAQLCNNSNV